MCHGPTGQGAQMGVALTNGLEVAVIEEGHEGHGEPGRQDAHGRSASADQLDALAEFVAAGLPASSASAFRFLPATRSMPLRRSQRATGSRRHLAEQRPAPPCVRPWA